MFGFKNVLCLLAITLLALGGMVAGHDDHGHGVEVLSSYGGLPALGYTGEVQYLTVTIPGDTTTVTISSCSSELTPFGTVPAHVETPVVPSSVNEETVHTTGTIYLSPLPEPSKNIDVPVTDYPAPPKESEVVTDTSSFKTTSEAASTKTTKTKTSSVVTPTPTSSEILPSQTEVVGEAGLGVSGVGFAGTLFGFAAVLLI